MNPETQFGRGGLNRFLDVDELLERIDLDADEIAWRKEFVGFDSEDERRLSALEPLLRENQESIADDFYENLTGHQQTRDIFERSPKGIEALKETQRAYLVSLATGEYDEAYFANRARIGKLHELLDMPLKHYVGQYGVYYNLLFTQMNQRMQTQVVDAIEAWLEERDKAEGGIERVVGALGFGGDETEGLEESFEETVRDAIDDGMMDVLSLLRIINLDLQVATDTYVDSYASRLERSIERRKRLAHQVEAGVRTPIEQLHGASRDVAARAEGISELTEQQAANIQSVSRELAETSAAVEEVASVTNEVRHRSEHTESLASDASSAADETLAALESIEDAATDVESTATALEARIDEIDDAVESIDELAKRTRLLATNAGIEATRSGGESAAFGVLADEVRAFTEEAQADLDAIETALEGVREATAETLETADRTVADVESGTDRVRETITDLDAIYESAEATAVGLDDVASATDQQAENVERAASRVEAVTSAADKIASQTELVATASEQQVTSLETIVGAVRPLTEPEEEPVPVYDRV